MLPHWPPGTVAVLITTADAPRGIPVSAVYRADDRRLLLGLAHRRGSLKRLRDQPEVAVVILAADVAVTARGRAQVIPDQLVEGVAAVEVQVEAVDDHLQPTFALERGVSWHWTDAAAEQRDHEVGAALSQLAERRLPS